MERMAGAKRPQDGKNARQVARRCGSRANPRKGFASTITARFGLVPALLGIAIAPATAIAQPVNLLAPIAGAPAPPASSPALLSMIPVAQSPQSCLMAASSALETGRYAVAEQALEQAETGLLNLQSSARPETAPGAESAIRDIQRARQALARRDSQQVAEAINEAESALSAAVPVETARQAVSPLPEARSGRYGPAAPGAPSVTYALLPGHWQLQGATAVWIPPETTLRRVESRPFIEGHYVWRGGAWVWIASHYANSGGE